MPAHLLQYSDLEGLYDDPEGAARFAGRVAELRTPETVVVGTGDNFAPSVLSLVTGGRQALDLFEHLQPDVDVFGNHDFDVGAEALRELVRESPQTWLNANLRFDGEPFARAAGAVPATVVESDGTRVGLVGVTTADAPEMVQGSIPLSAADPAATVAEHAGRLREERGADRVVALAHSGREVELARSLADETDAEVDAVLGGHDHEPLHEVVDGTPVVRPGPSGHRVAEVRLGDPPSVACHEVAGASVGASTDAPVADAVRDALRERMAAAGLTEVVATVDEPVSRSKAAGSRGESRVGNLVTDAYRWATGADVALLAARAVREGAPLAGAVTVFDLVEAVPFEDRLVRLALSGADLRAAVAELDHRIRTMRDWYFGHVSGAQAAWDADGTLASVRVGGEPVLDDATYTVATSGYYVETDHIFSAFGEPDVVAEWGVQYDALVEYAREEGLEPEVEGRIRRPDEAKGSGGKDDDSTM